jgi:large conductance mechanosensitive channel
MKKLFEEFKTFIIQGNAMDLAIGIIIGSAFSVVVNSIVDNLLMPPLGLLLGRVNFQDLFIVLRQGEQGLPPNATLAMAKELGAVTFNYGQFLTDFVSFILLGFGVFLIIKAINKLKQEPKEQADPTDKDCPYCLQSIPIKATRCPYCTSQLE